MNAVCVDIATMLAANGHGTFGADGSIYAFAWNEKLDDQILIMDSGNIPVPLRELNENPKFQILVRGKKGADINTAYGVIDAIHRFLIVQARQVISLTEYAYYEPITGIISLGRDENDRYVFSSNYFTFRESI